MRRGKESKYKALGRSLGKLLYTKTRMLVSKLVYILKWQLIGVLRKYHIEDNKMYKLKDGSFVIFEDNSIILMKYGTMFHMELPEIDIKDLLMRDSMTEEEYNEFKSREHAEENENHLPEVVSDFRYQVHSISSDKLKDLLKKYEKEEEYEKCEIIRQELRTRG